MLNKTKTSTVNSIKINNNVIYDNIQISNLFNEYFVNVGNNLVISKMGASSTITTSSLQPQPRTAATLLFEPTTTPEIFNIIKSLNSHSSVGHDKISVKFLQRYNTEISSTISSLINKCISSGTYQNKLKVGLITPYLINLVVSKQ